MFENTVPTLRLACLPTKNDAQRRPAEVDVVNYPGRIKIRFKVSVDEREIHYSPSPVPDTRGSSAANRRDVRVILNYSLGVLQ